MKPLPVGRLAPSPTGELHLGHARSFLLAWWSIRSRGGRLLLRIEDLDCQRARPEAIDGILRDLTWLGLDWDEGPLRQSEDPGPSWAAIERLLAAGRAYPCTCSRRELEAIQSAPHAADGTLRYPGTCRDRWSSIEEAERATGTPAGVRLRVPAGEVSWTDALRGPQTANVAAEVGDFLLARRDGVLGYQLAVVVDDARQGVTEVLRGDDLVPSTARQLLLQRSLQLPSPTWIHVPLVLDEHGQRLAKRAPAWSLALLRERGVRPERVVQWAAASAGLDVPHPGPPASFLPHFSLAALPREPARLSPATLAFLQGERSQDIPPSAP